MYLRYGSYTHAANEALVTISRENLRNEAFQPYAVKETWTIQGKLTGDTQAEIKTAVDGLKAAYANDGGNLELLHNDGSTVSAHALASATAFGGVRVLRGPDFPESRGADYATYRTYTITLEAEYPVQDTALLRFDEALIFSGGGPLWGHLSLTAGPPQKQLLHEAVPFQVIQRGTATGHLAYPVYPASIWPGALRQAPEIVTHTPRRVGDKFREWQVDWSYEHEDALPLVGLPHLWT